MRKMLVLSFALAALFSGSVLAQSFSSLEERMTEAEFKAAGLDKLSPEDQALVRQAAKDSIPVNRELWAAREKVSEEKVRAAGVQIIDQIDKTPFMEAMVPVYQKHANTPKLQSLVERIQATE